MPAGLGHGQLTDRRPVEVPNAAREPGDEMAWIKRPENNKLSIRVAPYTQSRQDLDCLGLRRPKGRLKSAHTLDMLSSIHKRGQ